VFGPVHGRAIARHLQRTTDDVLQVEHGSLYPALHRLEREGWLAAEWKMSEANRRAKYYRLTPSGKRHLLREHSRWDAVVRTVARVMRPSEES
jgi:transcriptional regulator